MEKYDPSEELEDALIRALNLLGDITLLNTIIDTGIINEGILSCGVEMFENYSKLNEIDFINSQRNEDRRIVSYTENIEAFETEMLENFEASVKGSVALNELKKKRKKNRILLTIKETVELIILVGTTELKECLEENKMKNTLRICVHELNEFELFYQCKTCNIRKLDQMNSVFCNGCFVPQNHLDHNYEFRIKKNPVGKCDCGDKTRLDPNSFCQ